MIPHDILTLYSAKMLEYGIAVLFLLAVHPVLALRPGPVRREGSRDGAAPTRPRPSRPSGSRCRRTASSTAATPGRRQAPTAS